MNFLRLRQWAIPFLISMTGLCALPAWAQSIHWFEAEDFNGNGKAVQDDTASGGQSVQGKTWYVLAREFPFPREGGPYEVWARIWNDVPAGWFVQDYANRKVKHQVYHREAEQWSWVRMGKYQPAEVGEKFWGIYIGSPGDKTIASANGRLDAIVLAEATDEAALEAMTQEKMGLKTQASQADTLRAAHLKQARRAVHIPLVEGKPTLDGHLEDTFWSQAALVDEFVTIRAQAMATQKTEVRLAAGKDALYVGVVLHESLMRFIHQVKTIPGDNVWTDDTFELFIDPQQTFQESHHFIVNPLGVIQDNLGRLLDRADGAQQRAVQWHVATKTHDDRWVVEMALPWEALGKPRPQAGEVWNINFARAERPHSELSYWNNTETYFFQPERMGLAVFGQAPVSLLEMSLDEGRTSLAVQTYSRDGQPHEVELSILRGTTEISRQRQAVTPDAQSSGRPVFPLADLSPGRYQMVLSLAQGKQQEALEFHLPLVMYSDSLASAAWPPEIRDNVLHMAQGTVQHCFFVLANHSSAALDEVDLVVQVPAWLEVLDPRDSLLEMPSRYFPVRSFDQTMVDKDGRPYRVYRMRVGRPIPVSRLESRQFYQSILLFFAQAKDSSWQADSDAPIHYHLESAAGVEQVNTFTLRTLPAVQGSQPREWLVHNWLWTINPNMTTWTPLAATLAQVGFNSVDSANRVPEYIAVLRDNDLGIINNMYWYWWYPDHAKAHPDHVAINYEGKPVTDGKICPTRLLADNGKLAREALEPTLARVRNKLGDGVVWNLEGPAAWDVCFCPLCIEAFKKQAGLGAAMALTPRQIRSDHSPQWIAFATAQNTGFLRILREEMHRIKPDAVVSIYSGNPGMDTQMSYRVDWSQAARHLDATFMSYYAMSPTALDQTFNAGMKQMIHQVKAWSGNDAFKAIATLTPGYQRGQYLQPTADLLGMQVMRSAASGADGVSFWWWGPFDGAYYTRLAEATSTIASIEPFLLQGRPDTKANSLIQGPSAHASWEVFQHAGSYLILLMNHDAGQSQTFDLSRFLQAHAQAGKPIQKMPQRETLTPAQAGQIQLAPLRWQALVISQAAQQ